MSEQKNESTIEAAADGTEASVNEMDAPDVLERHRKKEAEKAQSPSHPEKTTEQWVGEMIRAFDAGARAQHRKQGWEAFELGCISTAVALACGAALVTGLWRPIVVCIGAANLLMTGAWLYRAKDHWEA